MKKILKLFFLISVFLITGCGAKGADNVLEKLEKKLENVDSYYVEGVMEIMNNEDTYTYDVKVSYQKDDYYRIELVNTLNNHEQVILKNDDGVYVVTPSLNKSFKFQSDWPYNNSQVYLLNSVLEDLLEDEDRTSFEKGDGYYFVSSVHYPNNKSLVKQKVYVDKDSNITKTEVLDKDDNVQIVMEFKSTEYNKKFDNNYFELSELMDVNNKKNSESKNNTDESNSNNESNTNNSNTTETESNGENTKQNSSNNTQESMTETQNSTNTTNSNSNNNTNNNVENNSNNNENSNKENAINNKTETTATIDDIVYPMYLPDNTYLTSQEKVDTEDGQRLILTFGGDSSFILVEETVNYSDDNIVIPVSGEFDFLSDVIGVIGTKSLTWHSNGIEYYMASDSIETSELIEIAKSISVLPVSK